MSKIKITSKFWLFFVMILFLTGCWDRSELESNAYVIGLGLDRSKEEGKIKVTMLIANPEVGSMQGGGGSLEEPREIITFDAIDPTTAKNTANAIVSRHINYKLLKIIIASEEFAKDSLFLPTLYGSVKDKEIRLDTYIAISKEKAYEYFKKNRPKMETRPQKYFQYMIENGTSNGFIPDSTLFRFFKSIERGSDLSLAMYTTAEREKNPPIRGEDEYLAGQLNAFGELDDTQFIGAAVFKDGVMINKLTGHETRMVNILDDTTNIKDILINYPDPFSEKSQKIAARMMKTEDNKVKMKLKGEKPKIMITVPLEFSILSNPTLTNYQKSKKNRQVLEKHIADDVKTMFETFLEKTQTDLKGVPYPLSVYARKYFPTIQEFEKFNWSKSYPEVDIEVKADIKIIDFGKQDQRVKGRED